MRSNRCMFVLAAMALLAIPAVAQEIDAQRSSISWKRLLGQSTASFMRTMAPFARCVDMGFVSYNVPVIDDKTIVPSYWTYDQPMSGNAFPYKNDEIRSRSIAQIGCEIDDIGRISAYAHNGGVYQIVVAYRRCSNSGTCRFDTRPYDEALYQAMKVKDAFTVEGYPPKDSDRLHIFVFEHIAKDPALSRKLRQTSCWNGPISGTPLLYRCLVDVNVSEGVWHAISMQETFEKGWLSETVLARLAARQEFSLIEREREAHQQFLSEVQAVLAVRREVQRRAQSDMERGRQRKNDLLGRSE